MAVNRKPRDWARCATLAITMIAIACTRTNANVTEICEPRTVGNVDDKDATRVAIYLRECLNDVLDLEEISHLANEYRISYSLDVVPLSMTCDTRSWEVAAMVGALESKSTSALIAALDRHVCDVAVELARVWNKPLFTWSCPLKTMDDVDSSLVVRLSPSFPGVARAITEIMIHLHWRTVVVIGADDEPWSSLGRAVVNALRDIGVIPRHRSTLTLQATSDEIREALKPLQILPYKVAILCLPLVGNMIHRVLMELDTVKRVRITDSIIVLIHIEEDEFFLPKNIAKTRSAGCSDSCEPNESRTRDLPTCERFAMPSNISNATLDNLMAMVPFDYRYNVESLYNSTEEYTTPTLMHRLNESLRILTNDNSSINSYNNKVYTYALLHYHDGDWKPVMSVNEDNGKLIARKLMANALIDEELFDIVICVDGSIDCVSIEEQDISFRTAHIVVIILGLLLFTVMSVFATLSVRKHLSKKRMSKIILTASDFVFPQVADSKRVDEGIEAMLCCWLQQLQEFGGPEVEKPDLLQGSVGSARSHLRGSTGSLVRHTLLRDPRVTYNGDLVQLKDIPCQGTFELKSKAMDVIDTLHGLRHENLNPLIGCLTEPTRPCLVSEFCSRGSLEDVLVQDEIKLDWSFRLSLLTDLVRGMKYLHSTPIRAHGYLTSRNCVIDARWVLKVTDYGLPAFYKAQNIVPPTKTSRDLLWTAPELLRHSGLREKGTQPGDVYSFGIIMQEVVLRGEPFCMLSLSPEDIIEKVKRPPPLIRPSVSKGAAPPEAINIMRQCWAESADMRPDFNDVHELFEKLNHGRKVNFVDTMFQMLEKYSNNLEELIRERTEQLDMEKKKTEQLLNRMLPSSVAEKLKLGMPVDPEEFSEVTIYFSDIVGFTTISAYSTPFQVVDLLNDLYTCFDATINAYTVYKVETIGDAYMVVAGCPVRIPDHASQIATMALDLLHQSGKFNVRHLPNTQLRLRIGLHTGPCCAGVVGLTMPRYCLFGDTVNTASRMESTGAPWRIHLSQATRDRLMQVGGYYIEYRGPTDVKGKGKMSTYWLLGKQGFDKELPVPPPFGEDHGLDESLIAGNLSSKDAPGSPRDDDSHKIEEKRSAWSSEDSTNIIGSIDRSPYSQRKTIMTRVAVSVSVHDDKDPSIASYSPKSIHRDEDQRSNPRETNQNSTSKVVSEEIQTIFNPLSGTDVATTLLGASTSSLASSCSALHSAATVSSGTPIVPFRPGRHRRNASLYLEEEDLSTPYNHYRCISPNEHHGRSGGGNRFLRRQFSLDRADDPTIAIQTVEQSQKANPVPRLYKQNSAGAANDLERIEEIPTTPRQVQNSYRNSGSVSLSVESLSLH